MPNFKQPLMHHAALAAALLVGVSSINANAEEFRYATGLKPSQLQADGKRISQRQFESGLARQLAKLKRGAAGKDKGFDFTSINVVEDCTASVTCGNGEVIECSIKGLGSCESGLQSVACITSNHTESDTCDPPQN